MLKYIDVLIGLAVVMVAASMSVTVLTQAVTNLRKSRGKELKRGIIDLLQQINPSFAPKIADAITTAVLTHPLIREGQKDLGTVIHREELTKLLLELATVDTPQKLDDTIRLPLREALAKNGITNPEQTIQNIRMTALQLEQSHPELANNVRHGMAIVQEAKTEFVAKLNGWFDQTIDRVSSRFTFHARYVTLFNACLVALFLQLDTLAILNRLAVDDTLRAATVEQAKALVAQGQDPKYAEFLKENPLLWIPQTAGEWTQHWNWNHLPGLIVTMLLLNLGAPFWFNALKNLLQLRSVVAQKDDAQRLARQTTQEVSPAVRVP